MLGNLRRTDALLAVVDGFSGTGDPATDRASLELELLVADRDHVERRLERVRTQAKSGDPKLKEEVAALERVLAHLDGEQPLSDYPAALPAELEPLTTKPLIVIENGPGGVDLKLGDQAALVDGGSYFIRVRNAASKGSYDSGGLEQGDDVGTAGCVTKTNEREGGVATDHRGWILEHLEERFVKGGAGGVLAHDPRVSIAHFFDWVRGEANEFGIPARGGRVVARDALADLH